MDVKEIFEDNPHTRGQMFYNIYEELKNRSEEEILELFEKVKEAIPDELKDKTYEIACIFEGLHDQYKQEEIYKEHVLDPCNERLTDLSPPIYIKGFEL